MKKMCFIRFDDICPTMDWENFEKAEALMDKYNIKPLIGIIPFNLDENQIIDRVQDDLFWKKIHSLCKKGWKIALHGYNHVYDQQKPKTILCGKKHSEFAGNAYHNQFEKIQKGKKILESNGIFTDVFFAPAHTFDVNTLKALYSNGFKYNSDGFSSKIYRDHGVRCIPAKCFGVPHSLSRGINTIIIHTSEWRDSIKGEQYNCLERFCQLYRGDIYSFEDIINTRDGFFIIQKLNEKAFKLYQFVRKIAYNIRRRFK